MTTMLTLDFVIASFFVTTLEKRRYCDKQGKQSMFRPLNLQGKLFVLQSQPSARVPNRFDLPEHRGSLSGQLSIILYHIRSGAI